jgi:UDP-N-acetylglucosamine:LPS N-acetylglucosamine transferase
VVRSCGETQAIFLAGKNQRLYCPDRATIGRGHPFRPSVIGYTNAMEKLMSAADVMISKAWWTDDRSRRWRRDCQSLPTP